MTDQERIDRLEHVTAGFAERWKQEREEDRALWRDTQRQLNALARKIVEVEEQMLRNQEQVLREMLRYQEQAMRDREESRERGLAIDQRIDKLVSAMGGFISRQGGEK